MQGEAPTDRLLCFVAMRAVKSTEMSVDTVLCACFERALSAQVTKACKALETDLLQACGFFSSTSVDVNAELGLTVLRLHIEGIDMDLNDALIASLEATGRKLKAKVTLFVSYDGLDEKTQDDLRELHEKLDLLESPFLGERLEVIGPSWQTLHTAG